MGFPDSSVVEESTCNAGDPSSIPALLDLLQIHWRRDRLPTPVFLGFPCGSAGKESAHNAGDLGLIPWRRERLPTPVFLGFPCGSAGKESAHNVGDLGSVPGLERSPGEGKGYTLQYSGLENSMDYIWSMGSQRVKHD